MKVEKQDLVKLKPGCLVALAGLALLEAQPSVSCDDRESFTWWANGYSRDLDPYGDGDLFIDVEGVVTSAAIGLA